ncbi:MAG: GNAT family N-acetyltransferase [Candidatus Omnitrophica bacterium]|nr:GNAT family N-acetyltransferase [Candidatus Omnitrophota bacterium]
MVKLAVHKNLSEISPEVWDGFFENSDRSQIFQSYAWNKVWLECLGKGVEPLILSVHDNGQCLGIAPLCIETRGGKFCRKVVRFISDDRADYLDFLFKGSNVMIVHETIKFLCANRGLWDEAEFNNIPDSSLSLAALADGAEENRLPVIIPAPWPCPALVLKEGSANALKKDSLRWARKELRKMEAKAFHWQSFDEITPRLEEFFDQHVERWGKTMTPSLFTEDRMREFYRQLVARFSSLGQVVLSALYVQNKPIAFHFGFVDQQKLLWYKPSFDKKFARYSPGLVMLAESIEFAQSKGFSEIDFTRGDEAFKKRFSTLTRYNRSVFIAHSFLFWARRLMVNMIRGIKCRIKNRA